MIWKAVLNQEGDTVIHKYVNWLNQGGTFAKASKYLWTGIVLTALLNLKIVEAIVALVFGYTIHVVALAWGLARMYPEEK